MASKQTKLSDQVREAVDVSGKSRYRICKELGIAESLLSRFMSGKSGVSLETLDALAEFLELRIVQKSESQPNLNAKRRKKG